MRKSLIQQNSVIKDTLLNSAIGHNSFTLAIQLIVFEDTLLDSAVRKRSFGLSVELIMFELAFLNEAVGIDARCVTVHFTVSVLSLGKARVRQMDA